MERALLEDDDLAYHSVTQDFARLCALVGKKFSRFPELISKHQQLFGHVKSAELTDLLAIVKYLPAALTTLEAEHETVAARTTHSLGRELLQEGQRLLAGRNIELLSGALGTLHELFTLGAYYGWPTEEEHRELNSATFFYLASNRQEVAEEQEALAKLEAALLRVCRLLDSFMARDDYDPRYENFESFLSRCRELLDRLEVEKLMKST